MRFLAIVDYFYFFRFLHLPVELRRRPLLFLKLWVNPRILDDRKLRPYVLLDNLFVLALELHHSRNTDMLGKLDLKR